MISVTSLNARTFMTLNIQIDRNFRALHGFLIGSKGTTRIRLEQETRTKIIIPKKDEEGDIGNLYVYVKVGSGSTLK